MVITHQGDNYFKIQSGNLTLLVDPKDARSFRGAGVVLNTLRPPLTPENKEEDAPFWIEHQGEYEVKGVGIRGFSAGDEAGRERTIYRISFEDVDILVLGHLVKEPAPALQENLRGASVVIVPSGGKPLISETAAAKLVRQIEPAMVIPALTRDPKAFFKEFNASPKSEEKIVFKAKDLKPGAMEIRHLKG